MYFQLNARVRHSPPPRIADPGALGEGRAEGADRAPTAPDADGPGGGHKGTGRSRVEVRLMDKGREARTRQCRP